MYFNGLERVKRELDYIGGSQGDYDYGNNRQECGLTRNGHVLPTGRSAVETPAGARREYSRRNSLRGLHPSGRSALLSQDVIS